MWVIPAAGGTGQAAGGVARPPRDQRGVGAPTSRRVYFTVQDHGSTHALSRRRGRSRPHADRRGRRTGRRVVVRPGTGGSPMRSSRSRAPAEVFVKTAASAPQPAHDAQRRDRSPAATSRSPEAFEFASFDGTQRPGVPDAATPARGRAASIRSSSTFTADRTASRGPRFVHKSQVYAGEGYAVVMVNYRGSSGYGQKFTDGTVNDQNGSEFKDVARRTRLHPREDAVPRCGSRRASRAAATAVSSPTGPSRRRRASSRRSRPRASATSLSHGYLIWAQDYTQVEWGGRHPWQDDVAKRMWERSALAHVAKVKTPTMFIHGELDQDVPIQEAEQMFIALKQVGVEAVLAPLSARGPRPARARARRRRAACAALRGTEDSLKPESKSSQN